MKKLLIISLALMGFTPSAHSQSAIDAYRLSQPDLKGTARYMGMGGAFNALGGDLSAITVNPAGIGVYRSSDIGFTLDLDCQSATSNSMGSSMDLTQTKFLLNNIGAVFTLKLPSSSCPNLNFGFTYNKSSSFNRKYGGGIPRLYNSMSNYIAGIANGYNITESELATDRYYDPYNPGFNEFAPPWITILGYDSYLINPESRSDNGDHWVGQWGDGTQGSGEYLVQEWGSLNEYNIVLGGNISDVVFWGMNFDIINLDYEISSIWGENLSNAYLQDNNGKFYQTKSNWSMNNVYNVSGTGFNYQIGLIVKPVQELRLGLAFHTPTWYSLTEAFGADIQYSYNNGATTGYTQTNGGILGYNNVNFRSPMKLTAGVAGVIGQHLIVSFDYEWTPYNKMHFSESNDWGYGYGYDYDYGFGYDPWYSAPKEGQGVLKTQSIFENADPYFDTNNDIKAYYQATNTFRVGAEFRITPNFSLRAGYASVSSPVKSDVKDNMTEIYTSGTMPNYRFDNKTNYITCGLGWKYKHFYADLAYVYKKMTSEYHAYTPDVSDLSIISPSADVKFSQNQIVLSAGLRF